MKRVFVSVPSLYGGNMTFEFHTMSEAWDYWNAVKKAIAKAGYALAKEREGSYIVTKNGEEAGSLRRGW